MTDRRTGPQDVITYLRWLADQPDGINHRQWLFRAALMLTRTDMTIHAPLQERHGDETI